MHIEVSLTPRGNRRARVLIDGADVTNHVLAEGFAIGTENLDNPTVTMVFAPDVLEVSVLDGDLLASIKPEAD